MPFRTDLSCGRTQAAHAQQVVGGAGELRPVLRACHTLEARLAQPANSLAPAEDLVDALPNDLANLIAARLTGAIIEARRDVPVLRATGGLMPRWRSVLTNCRV